MKKFKKILLSTLSLLCVGAIGTGVATLLPVTADDTASDYNGNFFTVSSGTLTATQNTSNLGTGLKLAVTGATTERATIKYNDYLPVSALSDAISFQVLPTTAGELDFEWMEIVLRDSEDTSKLLNVIVTKSKQQGCNTTAAYVTLEDYLDHYSGSGDCIEILSVPNASGKASVRTVGFEDWSNWGYSTAGNFISWGNTWGEYTPYLTATDGNTKALNLSFADNQVKLNDYLVADFENEYASATKFKSYFEAATERVDTTTEAGQKFVEKYTTEYVNNLFSSGKFSIEIEFGSSTNDYLQNIALGDFAIQINSIGGKALYGSYEKNYESVSTEFRQPDATKVTASTGSYASENTTNVGLGYEFSGNGSTFELPGTYNFNDLTANMGELIKLQVNPKNEGEVAVSLLEIKFIDSENPYRYLDVVVTCNDIYNSAYGLTWNTSALVTLVDSQTFFRKGNYNVGASTARLFLNDGQTANAISNTYNNGSYHALGATIGEHSTKYPIMAKKAGENTSAISVTYDNYVIKVNGVKVVNLLDSGFLNGSSLTSAPYYVNEGNKDERISARYTESYVKGLFASGKVKVQLQVNHEQPLSSVRCADPSLTNTEVNGEGTINVINLFGQAANTIQDNAFGLQDTVKPVITTNTESLQVEAGKAYSIADLKAMFTATDNVAPVLNETITIYNSEDVAYTLGETFTFSAGDYVTYTATDDFNNTASKTVDVKFCVKVSKIVNGVTVDELVEQGAIYTFAAATVENKVFVGWQIGADLYPANYQVTVNESISATAVAIEFNMVKGASIRIDADAPGMRWCVTLGETDKDALGDYATEWGMRVTSDEKEGYLAIPADIWVDDGKTEYRCAMTDLDDTNEEGLYDIVFTGRAYVKITYADGSKATIWAVENDNARSISQVATLVYDMVPAEFQAVLDEFITVNGES